MRRVLRIAGKVVLGSLTALVLGAVLLILVAFYSDGDFGIGAVVVAALVGAAVVAAWIVTHRPA